MPTCRAEDDSASSLSFYTNASTYISHTQADRIDISRYRPAKRRKVAGLNTRFDRMIESVNTSLSYGNHSPASSRKRMKSESGGTSSVSSHDVPKTPVDVYSSPHPVKLGKGFSVLKMKKAPLLPQGEFDGYPKPVAPPKGLRNPLPDWLANTFSSLEADHPLRGLVSPSRINSESGSKSPLVKLQGVSHEEDLVAFSPFKFDKQEAVLDAAYRADSTLTKQGNISSVIPQEPTLSHLQLKGVADALPFSTPGCFAPFRRPTENPIVDGTSREPLVPVPQQMTSHATNMMHPPALPVSHLRRDDEIERLQFTQAFSNLTQDNESPSDFQEHDTYISHNYQMSWGDNDHLNVYATPGPTFACSRPVYFDSPTEDPSLSDPLQPESYELDLNAINFRWRPFLRSNAQESNTNRDSASPSPPLGHAVSNRTCDQSGWHARLSVDQGECNVSSEELPSLAEDIEITYLDDAGAILPSNVYTTTTKLSAISNPVGTSMINDVQQVRPASLAPGVLLSPLRDLPGKSALLAAAGVAPRGDGRNIQTSEEFFLLPGEEITTVITSEAHGTRPSTPIRQVPVSPPSAPQKARSSQWCRVPVAPVRKTSSTLSWVIPLKFSKRIITAHDGVNSRLSRVPANSHDSIESWSETS